MLPSLPPSEAAVAREVLAQPEKAVRWSVDTLAERAGMSTTTVLRFCRSLGFSGFTDFKIALATELHEVRPKATGDIGADDTTEGIARKVFEADLEAIRETLAMLDARQLEAAAHALNAARRIEIYGIGSSAPIALDAYYRLLRIGMRVGIVIDSHMMAVSASLLTPGDVALVVSHTGRTTETLSAAEKANAVGAKVIALTSFFRTPLIDVSDIALVTATSETTFRVEAMSSRIAHLSVIDALYAVLATLRFDTAGGILERTGKVIEEKRLR